KAISILTDSIYNHNGGDIDIFAYKDAQELYFYLIDNDRVERGNRTWDYFESEKFGYYLEYAISEIVWENRDKIESWARDDANDFHDQDYEDAHPYASRGLNR